MEKFMKAFVWLFTGLILSYIAAASFASGELNINCFYNAGMVDDLQPDILQMSENGFEYASPEDDYFTVTDNAAKKYLGVTSEQWNYIIFDIGAKENETIDLRLTAYNKKWEEVGIQEVELQNGKNCVAYNLPACDYIVLEMNEQLGKNVMFRQIQFREKLFAPNKKNAVVGSAAVFILYLLISAAYSVFKKKEKNTLSLIFGRGMEYIYSWYMKIQYRLSVLLFEIIGKKEVPLKRQLRIASLSIWILAEILMRGYGLRSKMIWFHYVMAIAVVFIFAITSLEHRVKPVKWNKTLFYSWFALGIIMVISCIAVEKKWPWVGVMFLTVYGLFYYIWGNMKEPRIILCDIGYSLKIVFWLTVMISVVSRQYLADQPYSGIYKNQNVFTSFLIMILAVNLTQIINIFLDHKYLVIKNLLLSAENCVILFFLYRTESRGGLLTCGILMLIFFIHFLKVSVMRKKWRIIIIVQTVILIVPVFLACEWTYLQVQKISPFSIKYEVAQAEEDVYASDFWSGETDVVYAGDGTHLMKSLGAKTFGAFTSGRTVIWKRYIREFNLFGHYNKEYIGGLSMHSHNAFIYTAYLYGMLSIVPYCVMWMMLFYRANLLKKIRNYNSFLPMALLTGFFMQAMTDTLEEPFSMESWIIVYIVIGILFVDSKKKNRHGDSNKNIVKT